MLPSATVDSEVQDSVTVHLLIVIEKSHLIIVEPAIILNLVLRQKGPT